MSDNEGEQQPGAEVEPVPEPEEPRTFLKQEQINEGLSLIARTAGKYPYLSKCLDGRSYAYSTLNLEEKEI
jgi:hypothetical protein